MFVIFCVVASSEGGLVVVNCLVGLSRSATVLTAALMINQHWSVARIELETNAIRRFGLVSIVSFRRPSLMIIPSASQFHVYLPWGQHPFSIVS